MRVQVPMIVLSMLGIALGSGGAAAQSWPQQPVKIVVGLAAGGTTDTIARIAAQSISARLGQPVTIENRTGAAGIIAAEAVARSPADGYTLVMGNLPQMVILPAMESTRYDPLKDFAPISVVGSNPFVLCVNPKDSGQDARRIHCLCPEQAGRAAVRHGWKSATSLLRWKAPFLNVPFFLIRAALYFGSWSFIALLYYRVSRGQDVTGDPRSPRACGASPVPAIIVLALTQTFASIDWIVSLTPHWYSTMFGVYFFAGSFVGFIALLSVVAAAMRGAGLLDTVITAEHLHDLGKFLFAFTAFWAYIGFSQFFLIWYANLPEETFWFKARLEGSWKIVSLLLMAGHFGVPFFYLMGRAVKRRGWTLAIGGTWLLAMHFVDLYWQVMPTLHPEGFRPSTLDVAAFFAVGGCFVAAAGWLMRRQALVPMRDPRLAEIARVRERVSWPPRGLPRIAGFV